MYRPCSKEVERLAKEKEIFKQIFIVNMVIMICIGTVLVKRGNVFLLAQEKKKKISRESAHVLSWKTIRTPIIKQERFYTDRRA